MKAHSERYLSRLTINNKVSHGFVLLLKTLKYKLQNHRVVVDLVLLLISFKIGLLAWGQTGPEARISIAFDLGYSMIANFYEFSVVMF